MTDTITPEIRFKKLTRMSKSIHDVPKPEKYWQCRIFLLDGTFYAAEHEKQSQALKVVADMWCQRDETMKESD